MAFVTLDDRSGRVELAVFSDTYQQYRDYLVKDRLVVVKGEITIDDYSGGVKMSAESVYDISKARELFAKNLLVIVNQRQISNGFTQHLADILKPFTQGHCPVVVDYENENAKARLNLGSDWRIHPTDELLHRLKDLAGEDYVKVVYH
jgi:DNA polymerase-3 subunit alpha